MDLLSPAHSQMLIASAISPTVALARGYRTITDPKELRALGFSPAQCRTPGLLVPLHTTDGALGPPVYRPDSPRVYEDKSKPRDRDGFYPNRVIKYELPRFCGVRLDCPPPCRPRLLDPSYPLWITEGQKKADALASLDLTAIALLGVWNFKGKNDSGGTTFLVDWDYIALQGRLVRIIFDSDVMTKPSVQGALDRLTAHLTRKGATVDVVYLPPAPDGAKLGVDDWLALGHTLADLERLVRLPRPAPKPAPCTVRLLDDAPPTLDRPLALIDGTAYAASWLYLHKTITEAVDKNGEIIRYDPPRETTEQGLYVVRSDGLIFGEGADQPLAELPPLVKLHEIPPTDRLWSKKGVDLYHGGYRPNPQSVFERLMAVVDRFIDFDRSLAPQSVMTELIACYILATWFLDGFNVIGFLWPNGDRGSGKTHLLLTVCELAYLGLVILAGSSFAALRDMADYGATLAFDDAENIANPKTFDADKRTLLLAGNRRGAVISVKEPLNSKQWITRRVNAYCPRLFSAIQLPDPVLESRTIIIPLVHSADPNKANADPLDPALWPCKRQELVDDLWALALSHLAEIPAIDRWVGDNAPLSGRNLQPWRAILSVAKWLEGFAVAGIYQRMVNLAQGYQVERREMESPDFTHLAIRALIGCVRRCEPQPDGSLANLANLANIASSTGQNQAKIYRFYTAEIAEAVNKLVQIEEANFEVDEISSNRVGVFMAKMRFKKERPSPYGGRQWLVDAPSLLRLARAYGITGSNEL